MRRCLALIVVAAVFDAGIDGLPSIRNVKNPHNHHSAFAG